MHKLYLLIIIFVFIVSIQGTAQDLSGKWTGDLYYKRSSYSTEFNLNQKGNILTGDVKIVSEKDSANYLVEGKLSGSRLQLSATKFIYKTGLHCLAKFDLNLQQNELQGSWGYNPVWGGCLPGVSGSVKISRNDGLAQNPFISRSQQSTDFKASDFEGNELIKALKDRTYYALIIGVDDYPDSEIQTLDRPVEDAKNLINTLTTEYTFESKNITFLKNPNRTELIDAFDLLAREITDRDNLLIFYAGHGIWDEKLNQGYWLPTNASSQSKAEWLSNGTIRDYIRAINSKHTILITDACFGGSILKDRSVSLNGRAMVEMYKRPSRKAMTSGALSTVPDQSIFIQYLIKNLKNNQSPLVSAEQLFGDFKVAVINNSETGQVPQYGAISLAGDEGGDFIFLRRGF